MRWTARAQLLRAMASGRVGYALYQALQVRIGDCAQPSFWLQRWQKQIGFAQTLQAHGCGIEGRVLVEVGTGWVPSVPIGFWLCGASRVHTYDLNPHFLPAVLSQQLHWLAEHESRVLELWGDLVAPDLLRERVQRVRALADAPVEFLREAGIALHAPGDAARTQLPPESVDIHYSNNVFEHIPEPVLVDILGEARRVLRPAGIAIHHVDPSDHFAHTDPSISNVNFLQFSQAQWDRLAGNRLAYHNRMREPAITRLFQQSGLQLIDSRHDTDPKALYALRAGLPLAPEFRALTPEVLARMNLVYVCRKG